MAIQYFHPDQYQQGKTDDFSSISLFCDETHILKIPENGITYCFISILWRARGCRRKGVVCGEKA
jgi:hypothetical protein